jgi:hypothetical protein
MMKPKHAGTREQVLVLEPAAALEGEPADELASELIDMVLDARTEREAKAEAAHAERARERVDGVILGELVAVTKLGPRVRYPGCPSPEGALARAAAKVRKSDIGRRAALLFENGDLGLPILVGLLHHDDASPSAEHPALGSLTIREQADRIEISCKKAISLSCGESTVIITPKGKILLRGKHLLSSAAVLNRLRGGAVRIN